MPCLPTNCAQPQPTRPKHQALEHRPAAVWQQPTRPQRPSPSESSDATRFVPPHARAPRQLHVSLFFCGIYCVVRVPCRSWRPLLQRSISSHATTLKSNRNQHPLVPAGACLPTSLCQPSKHAFSLIPACMRILKRPFSHTNTLRPLPLFPIFAHLSCHALLLPFCHTTPQHPVVAMPLRRRAGPFLQFVCAPDLLLCGL